MTFSTRTLVVVFPTRSRIAAVVMALGLLAAACGGDGATDTAAPAEADATTESADAAEPEPAAWPHTFVADQVGGGEIDAGSLEGRDIVLWFWAPW